MPAAIHADAALRQVLGAAFLAEHAREFQAFANAPEATEQDRRDLLAMASCAIRDTERLLADAEALLAEHGVEVRT